MNNTENEFKVERFDYLQLISENQNRTQCIQQIRQTASSICERRRQLAHHLIDSIHTIHEERIKIESAITSLEHNLGIIHEQAVESEIRALCTSIKTKLGEYEENAKILSERFENQKIKISSIGFRSQGKSNFTCLYSGLPESVVAVKGPIDEEDKTGAINIIHHKVGVPSSQPEIIVTFRSKEDVLSRVNEYLTQWPVAIKGKKLLFSYEEFIQMKRDVSVCHEIEHYTGHFDTSIKKGLLGFFGQDIDLSEVGKTPKPINVAVLPKYNDIQYNGSKSYSAVHHIDIYVDLLNDNLFENFEICDTKGSSTDVGGLVADKDIFSAIDSSDAAFTIIRVGQGQKGSEFITNVLYPHYRESIESINNKHFVIINVDKRCGQVETIDNACGHIVDNKIAQAIYVGSLKERPIKINYERDEEGEPKDPDEPKIKPPLFVEVVLLSMLERIAHSTKDNDDCLISKVNELSVSINQKLEILKTKLRNVSAFREESEDDLIIEIIRTLRDKTFKQINENNAPVNDVNANNQNRVNRSRVRRSGFDFGQGQQMNEEKKTNQQEEVSYTVEQPSIIDYEDLYKKLRSEKYSIFKILTGEDRNMQGKENQSVKDEIEESVRYIYTKNGQDRPRVKDTITDTVMASLLGDTSDSGRYIECVSMLFSNRIKDNFNKKLIPQNEIQFKDEADEIYKALWDGLKLNCFSGWGDYSYEKFIEKSILNDQLKALLDLYKDAYEATTDPILLFTPYDTLLDYFRRLLGQKKEFLKHEETDIVVDDRILIETIVDLIRVHNIPKMIVEKAADKKRRVDNLRTQIVQEIAPQTSFVQRMLPLYRLPEASPIFNNELKQRRLLNEKIRNYNSSKDSVIALINVTNLSIPL